MTRDTRRDFCGQVCRFATMAAMAPLAACNSAGPAGPSAATDVPALTPTPTPEGPSPSPGIVPPPTSPTVGVLEVVSATPVVGGFTVVVEGSPLTDVWGSARTHVERARIVRDVLLMRTGTETFSALSAVCTHEGCIVSRVARPVFVCPCHGSRYDLSGAVVQGPAPAALPQYATEFAHGVLTVRL